MTLEKIKTTKDIKIPKDPLERVIGQNEAVNIARVAAKQKRNLLLVGPPGTGKSMIALALSLHLSAPTEEVRIVHNPQKHERPFIEIRTGKEVKTEMENKKNASGKIFAPENVPLEVAEKLGFRCVKCGIYSSAEEKMCPKCGASKIQLQQPGPFGDMVGAIGAAFGIMDTPPRVSTTRRVQGKEEVVVYERIGEKIMMLDQETLEKKREMEKKTPSKILIHINRKNFVLATGASETELLGDVRHDPYGGHSKLGTLPYERVVAGSIHEAHEGVLFIDEISQIGILQKYILTAMQEKKFAISGRNPQSAGASVKVDDVPANFILVCACNIQDLNNILSPLRSRIIGNGYDVLIETTMPYNDENKEKYAQFIAQEIIMDGKIPHANKEAILAIIEEGKRRAKSIDDKRNALTLRLRELGGLIRVAGDLAVEDKSKLIEKKHIKNAIKISKTAEEQIKEKYGSVHAGVSKDVSEFQKEMNYYYWNKYNTDDESGYE